MYNDIIMLMQRWKRSRYLYILGIAIVSLIAGTISPIIPTALADTLTPARVNFEDKNLPFVRINRTVIKVEKRFSTLTTLPERRTIAIPPSDSIVLQN